MKQTLVGLSNSNSMIMCTAFEQLDSVDLTAATKFLILFGSDILLI